MSEKPDTPEDVVKEARELLKTHWFEARSRTIVGRVLVIDKLVASLCDEVEALRAKLKDPCLVAGYHVCGGAHNLSDLTKD